MNSRIEKDFEDFIFYGKELLVVEKALYSYLDKYKDQLIRGHLAMEEGTDKMIQKCIEKLKLHENFEKNAKFFNIYLKKYDDYDLEPEEETHEKNNNKVA
jgi:hypothetical protein